MERDHIVILNSGETTGATDEKAIRQLLYDTMWSLRPTEKAITVERAITSATEKN